MDNSFDICMNYKDKDNRFHVIKSANKGVSNARNLGISLAKGEYIQFVDSDDTIYSNMTQRLLETSELSGSDIVICNFYYFDEETKRKRILFPFENTQMEYAEFILHFCRLIYTTCAIEACWNKLYKRSILEQSNAMFDQNISYGEDLLFNLKLYPFCKRISMIEDPLYNYFVRKNSPISLSQKYRDSLLIKEIHLLTCLKEFIENNGIERDKYYEKYVEEHILDGINEFCHPNCKLTVNQIKSELKFFFDSTVAVSVSKNTSSKLKNHSNKIMHYIKNKCGS